MSPTARRAANTDIPEIVRVTNAAYRVEDFFIDGDRTHAAEVAAKMSSSSAAFLVVDAPDGTGLAASAYVELRGTRGYFGMLSVDPARQNTGMGRVLINAIESHFISAGCTAIDIDVVSLREELPAFYKKLGFVETGTAMFMNPHKTKDAHLIVMSKALREN